MSEEIKENIEPIESGYLVFLILSILLNSCEYNINKEAFCDSLVKIKSDFFLKRKMSLLAQASPFQESSIQSNNGKRMARMKNTYHNITKDQPNNECSYNEDSKEAQVKDKAEKINAMI